MSIITFDGSIRTGTGLPWPVTFILYVSPNSADNGLTLITGANVPQGWRIAQGSSSTGQIHGTFDSAEAQRIRTQVQSSTVKSGAPLRSITVYRDAARPSVVATANAAVGAFPYWLLYVPDNTSYVTVPMSGDLTKPAWTLGSLRWDSNNNNDSSIPKAFRIIANQSGAQSLAVSTALTPTGAAAANTSSRIAGKPKSSGTSGGGGGGGIKY